MMLAAVSLCFSIATAQGNDAGSYSTADGPDSDGDGLSNFREKHKYFTDPAEPDSDGDGVPDGDPDERREYAYTIRLVARVMPPVDPDSLTDDYQDGRVLEVTDEYVELEVVHYPLNTVAAAIEPDPLWRKRAQAQREYLRPGITTNWNPAMRRDLLAALAADGIVVAELTDKEVAERVSAWALERAKSLDVFTTYYYHYPGGRPAVYPGLEQAVERERKKNDPARSVREQIEHELLGRQMYYNETRGTCTSSAVYLATVLRAVGLPTRIVHTIPPVDVADEENRALVRAGLTHHAVRRAVDKGVMGAANSFAAHTFNEVWVGGRWRRLNYHRLGQNTLDANQMGLLTHINTFHDLSDAQLAPTWAARHPSRRPSEVFRFANPYTTLELSDRFGEHADVPNPPLSLAAQGRALTIGRVYWLHSKERPPSVDAARFPIDGSGHLLAHARESFDVFAGSDYERFYERVDKRFLLQSPGLPDVRLQAERGFWLDSDHDSREFYLHVSKGELAKMMPRATYTLHARNSNTDYRWTIAPELTLVRP